MLYNDTMEMEQMMACLLEEMRTNHTKADDNLGEMKEEMMAKMEINKERMDAKIGANNKKFEVLVSRMDIHQARTESTQEEMKAKMDSHHEK
jgi:hypothetical protein